eukprot:scaffold88151_cov48-Attheya_sp.AAC.1
MRFCMNDPLVKWISDALPIIMSNDHEFVLNDEDNVDANANKDGTGCIFHELVKKALMRSKRDHIGNELPEIAVDYLADEIADD